MDDSYLQNVLQKLQERMVQLEQKLEQSLTINNSCAQFLLSLEPRLLGTINHHTHHLKQTLNLIARERLRNKPPIRCVFLVHHISVWDALVSVYEAMMASSDFEPIVITIPHCFNKEKKIYSGEDIAHEVMQKAGIPHLRFGMPNSFEGLDILKALEPDIIFRQSPWEPDVPSAFATSEINFARLCYISYGFQTIQKDDVGSYYDADQPYHRACWRIFCLNEKNQDLIAHNSLLQGRNTVLTGYPKFDRLVETGKSQSLWPINRDKRYFRLIWGAHHSVHADWDGFGMFPRIYIEMLEWAKANQDIEIVFKPHPMLFESCAHGLMTQEDMNRFKADWQALPNTAWMDGGDYGSLFAASDAMISDGISFFSEYQLFDKPLVFLDSQRHSQFNPAGQALLKGMYPALNCADALRYIEFFKNGGTDTLKESRHAVISEIMPFPGESADRVLEAIRIGFAQEGRVV